MVSRCVTFLFPSTFGGIMVGILELSVSEEDSELGSSIKQDLNITTAKNIIFQCL